VTEQEWLTSSDPLQLVAHAGGGVESRKAMLFTVACFRRHWDRLPAAAQAWGRLAESAAEGGASRQNLDDAFEGLEEALNELGPPGDFVALMDVAYALWESDWFDLDDADPAWVAERKAQADLVRDVFGNPFRAAPVALDAAWRTAAVLRLAEAADAGAPDAHPVLADALEEAGCTDEAITSHLRSPGPHVRGCWAVDLILGKG
jgi:hypothetical protein